MQIHSSTRNRHDTPANPRPDKANHIAAAMGIHGEPKTLAAGINRHGPAPYRHGQACPGDPSQHVRRIGDPQILDYDD
jgi:hypothetical protein